MNSILRQDAPGRSPSPQQKLWAAVVNRARMDCAGAAYVSPDREAAVAKQWFESESEEPGSFLWVTSHLGICPKMIRSRLPQEKIRSSRVRYQIEWRA